MSRLYLRAVRTRGPFRRLTYGFIEATANITNNDANRLETSFTERGAGSGNNNDADIITERNSKKTDHKFSWSGLLHLFITETGYYHEQRRQPAGDLRHGARGRLWH